jgi:adenine-specific DNA-methyltransferase
MNSLLEKEGLGGKVQMVYIDPPYGVRYGSNFQPFVNRRDVKDGKDEDLTQEPETIRAFRDTWELGIHSYLTYLRDRLLLARQLLHESGSCFVQISDENLHFVRNLMDEVFGAQNLAGIVIVRKTAAVSSPMAKTNVLPTTCDYLVWYANDIRSVKYRQLFADKTERLPAVSNYRWAEDDETGSRRALTTDEASDITKIPSGHSLYRIDNMTSTGWSETLSQPIEFEGKTYSLSANLHWKTTAEGIQQLIAARRVVAVGASLGYVRFLDDFPVQNVTDVWLDTGTGGFGDKKVYAVQTISKVIGRCLLMTTDPGDLVFDPTCGSGTTAYVAEQWGRRWVTCDTSRVAITLAKQRLVTALYDYYELRHPAEGVASGFQCKTVPHVTLKSIANNPEIKEGMSREKIDAAIAKYADQETLFDQPFVDNSKARVAGPFTVEAVPAPVVKPVDEAALESAAEAAAEEAPTPADASVARQGETLRHAEWREELLKTGIRGRSGQRIRFTRVEPLQGTRWLHAEAETDPGESGKAERVVIHFGPEHAPLEQRAVESAWEEARTLAPKPALLVFAAFQFDPEAAKDIDELSPVKVGMTLLKAQMNPDLLTEDLKKKRASNESFWLVGQPDVEVRRVAKGDHKGLLQVEIHGFDYYDTRTGKLDSGDVGKIALWMLDTDYDGRSLYPRQMFFPMAGPKDGWARIARSLKAEIDEEAIEAYRGTVSLPFAKGGHGRLAVKIVDDRGIESLRVISLD